MKSHRQCMTFRHGLGMPTKAMFLGSVFLGSCSFSATLNKHFVTKSWPWFLIAKLKGLTLNHP